MKKVVILGAAGLVGQNLIARLKPLGRYHITGVDKHLANTSTLRKLHPEVEAILADLAEGGEWEKTVADADYLVILQAQIGGVDAVEFKRNNVLSTERILRAAKLGKCSYIVHVSSSVVNSKVVDLYTESKKAQESLVASSGIRHVILRPTLMFGWFDRKHLGWLRRFMKVSPVFPIPERGDYTRQPLYAGDFAAIVASCLDSRTEGQYNVSGLEQVTYATLIKMIKQVVGAKTLIVHVPYSLFYALLSAYAMFDKNPPFTVSQLEALVTPELFEIIDWPKMFGVKATPLHQALRETFLDPRYSDVALEF